MYTCAKKPKKNIVSLKSFHIDNELTKIGQNLKKNVLTQEIALDPSSETNRMSFTSFLWQNLWKIKDFVKICLNLCGLRTLKWYQIYQKIFDQRNKILVLISIYSISLHLATECNRSFKGRLRGTIYKSAETVHLIMLCYQGDAIRCALSADLKMVARNHLLSSFHLKESGCVLHVVLLHRSHFYGKKSDYIIFRFSEVTKDCSWRNGSEKR